MQVQNGQLLLYAVTDRQGIYSADELVTAVRQVLDGGATCVQLREKALPDGAFLEEAYRLQALCASRRIPLIINDRPDLALRVGAAGVHVGQQDIAIAQARAMLGDAAIIGGSAHSVGEALAAEAAGADYLGCGAVFGSETKRDARTLTPETLREICRAVRIPVVAIGGIHAGNIGELAGCGISGVAVVSALFSAPDRTAAARTLLDLSRRVSREGSGRA